VLNIGFGADAVHTRDPNDERKAMPVFAAPEEPVFPNSLDPDRRFERHAIQRLYFNRDITPVGKVKSALRRLAAGFKSPGFSDESEHSR
jgi:hypothetical protein